MELFLDSLDVKKIRKYSKLLAGVTTNPTLARRFGMRDDITMIRRIREALEDGEIHVEAFGNTADEIIGYAKNLLKKSRDKNLVFKIPFNLEGVIACKELVESRLKTNLHLVFSVNQALIAASIKSTYICPLVGRLDDIGHDAMENVKDMVEAFKANHETTKIMVSSVRHPQHVKRAYICGANAVTIPLDVIIKMFYHPLTTSGTAIFRSDIEATKPISTRKIDSDLITEDKDTLRHCISLMVVHKGGAVAVKSNNRLVGVFTAGDLKRLVEKGIQFDDDVIGKFMTKKPLTIGINESIAQARDLLKKFNINQLVVVDGENVIGILDSKDL